MNWDSQVKNYCFLVTGSAGFIGFHLARALLSRQARVVGLDNMDDNRESPGLKIIQLLSRDGAIISYNDPHIPRCAGVRHYPGIELDSTPLTAETLQEADLVLLVTDHSDYDYAWIASQARLIVDTRHAFRNQSGPHIYQA